MVLKLGSGPSASFKLEGCCVQLPSHVYVVIAKRWKIPNVDRCFITTAVSGELSVYRCLGVRTSVGGLPVPSLFLSSYERGGYRDHKALAPGCQQTWLAPAPKSVRNIEE